jgi:hypothetical protein
MRKVYVVMGSQGEYSDFTMWTEAAFSNRKAADEHASALNEKQKGRRMWDRKDYEVEVLDLETFSKLKR